MEIENLKRAFRLICCCNRHKVLDAGHQDDYALDTTPPGTTKGVALSRVTVTPHSTLKTLGYVVGVDDIDALVSDFEHQQFGRFYFASLY